jgi:hypothetical protein
MFHHARRRVISLDSAQKAFLFQKKPPRLTPAASNRFRLFFLTVGRAPAFQTRALPASFGFVFLPFPIQNHYYRSGFYYKELIIVLKPTEPRERSCFRF